MWIFTTPEALLVYGKTARIASGTIRKTKNGMKNLHGENANLSFYKLRSLDYPIDIVRNGADYKNKNRKYNGGNSYGTRYA